MYKKVSLIVSVLCLAMFLSFANAQEYTIGDYDFTWRVAKVGDVRIEIKKTAPGGVWVNLISPGGKLARLSIPPSKTKAIGEVLSKTDEYYNSQKKSGEMNAKDVVPVGDYKVTFSSSKSRAFQVSLATSKVFGSAVLMGKDQALKVGEYLINAEKMVALVNERVTP
ncbi:MAG: hypothetical protein HQ561_03145 [Desulfobacteraceae bacterium]|nr:hypothetical protein [Desulfobacteraceae bacterium]